MQTDITKDIIIGVTGGIFLTLFLGGIIVSFVFEYRRKQRTHKEEMILEKLRSEQMLLQTQIEVQEQTRKNLAADLHDNIGQVLSLTNVTLASININDKEKAEQKIAETQELVTRSIRELRQLSKIIHGEQLIQQGLLQTIHQEITWLERNGHYSVSFIHDLPDLDMDTADKDLFTYRLLQESLNNIIKHSGANKIIIELIYSNNSLQLTISDNGVGFNTAEKLQQKGGLGLLNMQKRVGLLNGSMQVNAVANEGTSVIFIIPYP